MLKELTKLGTIAILVILALVGLLMAAAWPWLVVASPYVVVGSLALAALAGLLWLGRFAIEQWQASRAAIAAGDVASLESEVKRAEAARDITAAKIAAERLAFELDRDRLAVELSARHIAAGLGYLQTMGGQNGPAVAAMPSPQIAANLLPAGLQAAPAAWPDKVSLFDLLTDRRGDLSRIVLGVTLDESGRQLPVTVELENMVHGAMGGETGSGKSSLAYSLAYQLATAPQDCRLILADPSETTWKTFTDHERLMYPIVSDDRDMLHVLNDLLAECERRTGEVFAPYPQVEKLSEYNALVGPADRLGYVALLIDEFPEYMENRDIEAALRRLIRKSRKAGIYLFGLGTSWKATDMDSSIKRQFRTKIHFAASDPESSRVLLGDKAAAGLRDPGRAYARLPFGNGAELVEIQAAYLGKADVMTQFGGPSILDLPTPPDALARQAVIEARNRGESLSECYRIYHRLTRDTEPPATPSGQQIQQIKDILDDHENGPK